MEAHTHLPYSPIDTLTTRNKDGDNLISELTPDFQPRLYGSPGCETWSVCFSPDGTRFAWSAGYGLVKVLPWPLPSNLHTPNSYTEEKLLDCGDIVWGMAFGPRISNREKLKKLPVKGQELLLATGLTNGTIKVWVVSTGQPSRVLTGPNFWLFKCSVSPDSSLIASVCNLDTKVYLWSLRSFTFVRNLKYKHQRSMVSCDFSADGALLAVGSYQALTGWWLDLWDPYTADHLIKVEDCDRCEPRNENLLMALTFSPTFPHLAFKDYMALRIWDMEQDKLVLVSDHNRVSGLCCAFHPRGSVIATGCREGHVKFWKVPCQVSSLRHLCRTALRFSVSTYQVQALPIPKKILDFLTYRDIPKKRILCCSEHHR
ncbi:WD repeat and SOCS box-containing protein 2 isoform X2 [Tachysurus fulvidraco]|uniref:WD repeat and SOCS box-containing protein 2 isoform X2 n=1 Tax=Tachysurus fulvidraco TaxID=1234273 RepID=UPI001FED83B4|nr:WD repeat and SOCS box-containing protein 2 isoform X2 [Tachysurus fulvidraco]